MKYNIETCLIEEPEYTELEEECKNNIDVLKKAGFDSLVDDLETKDENKIPFRLLSEKEKKIIKGYYSHSWSPHAFKGSPPLKVVSLIALCNEKEYFKDISIIGDTSSTHPFFGNFAVVGYTKDSEYYLVARWGMEDIY